MRLADMQTILIVVLRIGTSQQWDNPSGPMYVHMYTQIPDVQDWPKIRQNNIVRQKKIPSSRHEPK
jgi:hypothetical protein